MHKIVIVDDEPSIRQGLAELLDWASLGYRIAGSAASGKEALLLFECIRPDLMIVDIRMPGMDGMELIRELKSRDPGIRIIVLSGYADFNYAREAIALGVDHYLLKPVDEDELSEILAVIKQALDGRAAERGREGRAERALRGERLGSLLSGAPADAATWEAELSYWGAAGDGYRVFLFEIESMAADGETSLAERQIGDRLAASYEKAFGIVFRTGAAIGLLLAERELRDSSRRRLMTMLTDWAEPLGCRVLAASGDGVGRAADIPRSYATARLRSQLRFFYDGADFIGDETVGRLPAPSAGPFDPELLTPLSERLYLAVSSGNASRTGPLLAEIGDLMLSAGVGESALKARFVQLLARLLEKLSERLPGARVASGIQEARLLEILGARGYDAMLGQIAGLLADVMRQVDDGGGEGQIRRLTQLIDSHFKDNLKLEKLAEAFNYNSAYLGKLFRAVTGESFNTYLDKVRIAKAKQLLQAGLKVYEVADQVGYANPDYFHGKFRKYEGVSPTAYRNRCLSSWSDTNDDGYGS
ncbi:response regulator transcription factor [Cohnella sp. JJ-181]|uniref:response regulator transcription factor n=1 Tax=Cohnella rhizoplanae TaxID=2974897 RepID=UPI0022FFC352|nr:response regulator transcription factor [Cohnella sp. JJ-181]CAI6045628.1 Regulator of RpoS [Cohnella sp. JJ-181]